MKILKLKKKLIKITLGLMLVTAAQSAAAQIKQRSKFLPDHLKLQYAGNIGFISVGAGYTSKKEKLSEDIYYGYVPKSIGGIATHSVTGKLTWFPFIVRDHSVYAKPLSIGLWVNYAFGKQYFAFSPEAYPFNYYRFPTSIHIGLFEGGEVALHLKKSKSFHAIGLYYEVGTVDRALISYINNERTLNITDVFHLGLGIRAAF
jgi:hypothetical protein